MNPLLRRLSRTVARLSPDSVSVVVSTPAGPVPCRGTWAPEEEYAEAGTGEHLIRNSRIRIPQDSLPDRPAMSTEIIIAGRPYHVASTPLDKGVAWLIELADWDPRA